MSYYLTTGSNLRMYFHYPEGIQENGTLHVYGYKNARMEGFPIAKLQIPNFDLQKCHPSIYGSHYIETGISYTGNTWWFAWVDTTQDDSQNNFLGWSGNDFSFGIKQNEVSFISGNRRLCGDNSDPAGMPYGQSGLSGITLTTGLNKIFFSLEQHIQGFPQFGWPNVNKRNVNNYRIYIKRVTGSTYIYTANLNRNFFCAQDLLLFPSMIYTSQVEGRGLNAAVNVSAYEFLITALPNNLQYYTGNVGFDASNMFTLGMKYVSQSENAWWRSDFNPVYSPTLPFGYPTGWNNLGE